MSKKNGLVLTAGGARGAYQAGVLKRLGELPALHSKPCPFQIITGASAGALNGSFLATGTDDFSGTTKRIASLWSNLNVENVFKTDPFSLSAGTGRWMKDLALGGIFGGGSAQSLLDFTPLRNYIKNEIQVDKIQAGIQKGHLYAVAISATNYFSGKSYTFIQGQPNHPLWTKSRRIALSTELTVEHIWASCAIPIIFQPVLVETPDGAFYFGDGGLRLVAPFSPAIRLGASKIFAIGIRCQKTAEQRSTHELIDSAGKKPKMRKPPLAQIFGVALNSIFLDHLDSDLDHLRRMNELMISLHQTSAELKGSEPMRVVQPFALNPSVDLATVADTFSHKMPKMIRYLMEGLGSSKAQSADLLSYLLFDSSYTQALIDIGYQDAGKVANELESFLLDP
ncbi:MAG: patatin-like phospholipase family protein [Bdellovibrio sp.]|nr:patatin-like phospholipase family protein [Bdellovibrio sp.]